MSGDENLSFPEIGSMDHNPSLQQVMGPSGAGNTVVGSEVVGMSGGVGSLQDFQKAIGAGTNVFNGRMYFTWRRKLDVGLRAIGLYQKVQSGKMTKVEDQLLADCLVGCLSDQILSGFRGLDESGKAILDRLESEYNRKDASSKFAVLSQLMFYQYKGKGMALHCDEVIGLIQELKGMGMPLASELSVLILLVSLPAEYSTFATVIAGQDINGLTVDIVRTRAIGEEERLRRTESGQVLFSSNKPPSNKGSPTPKKKASKGSSEKK